MSTPQFLIHSTVDGHFEKFPVRCFFKKKFWLHRRACRIPVSTTGWTCASQQWKWNILTTRLPGKSQVRGYCEKCFPGGSDDKESASNAGDLGSIPWLGRSPGEGNGYPIQYFVWRIPWTEELVGYSGWGHKELDTTEQLTLSLWKVQLWTFLCMWTTDGIFLDVPRFGIARSQVMHISLFSRKCQFSKAGVPIYTPTSSIQDSGCFTFSLILILIFLGAILSLIYV